MEAMLGELQGRAADFAGRVEQGAAAPAQPTATPGPAVVAKAPVVAPDGDDQLISEWSFYGVLIGIALGLAGWLGWRSYEQRRQHRDEGDFPLLSADLPHEDRHSRPAKHEDVDISFDSAEGHTTARVDLELEGGGENAADNLLPAAAPLPAVRNSVISIADATVGEHFEANPVMELADIMLSFGRVKGAAQALREYIDSNPQEALQPWIRLMDVYRMAGMRDEFEEVGRNLNQHFNIEVQHWETVRAPDVPTAESIEEMPRIMSMISELWWTGDVVGYLYQLLRDNRGGKRAGFALPLVEEILFLIELKETSNRIEKKEEMS